jgi:hypothetical protein
MVRAPTPTRYRCPRCGARLQVAGNRWPIYVMGVAGGLLALAAYALLSEVLKDSLGINIAVIASACAAITLLALTELAISLYVLQRKTLEPFAEKQTTDD